MSDVHTFAEALKRFLADLEGQGIKGPVLMGFHPMEYAKILHRTDPLLVTVSRNGRGERSGAPTVLGVEILRAI